MTFPLTGSLDEEGVSFARCCLFLQLKPRMMWC